MFESLTYTIEESDIGPSQLGASDARWEFWVTSREGDTIHLICHKLYHRNKPSRSDVVRIAKYAFRNGTVPARDSVSWDLL